MSELQLGRIPRLIGIGLIKLYRLVLSPLIGRECRDPPTCWKNTEEAIGRFGLWPARWMARRSQRCGPFGASASTRCRQRRPSARDWGTSWATANGPARIDPKTRLDL